MKRFTDLVICTFCLVSGAFILAGAEDKEKDDSVIAIDFGNTYSCVGVHQNNKFWIISDEFGDNMMPSYVFFPTNGKIRDNPESRAVSFPSVEIFDVEHIVGGKAKKGLLINPQNTIFDIKRLIGRKWEDPSVQEDIKNYPFRVLNKNNKPHYEIRVGAEILYFPPEDITALIFAKLKYTTEVYLGKNVTRAVITVPAHFNDAQRKAVKDAGTIAGLDILRIINEATAASIAYHLDKVEGERNIIVFHLGGGTFDVSTLTVDHGVFEVMSAEGFTHLGGEDFDQRVMEHLFRIFWKKTGKDLRNNNTAVQKLRSEVERSKQMLSNKYVQKIQIEIESFYEGEDFSETLTKAKFEELNSDLFKVTLSPIGKLLNDSDMNITNIHDIILTGGSNNIPQVQQLIKEYFHGKDLKISVKPDEVVLFGAALQAAVLEGRQDDSEFIVCCDHCPLSLGIETTEGLMSKIIPRYLPIPVKKTIIFSTAEDNQHSATVKIFEGERAMAKDNHFLGELTVSNIPLAYRGIPKIIVTFELDVNAILHVDVEVAGSVIKNSLVLNSMFATDLEVEKMISDAEEAKEEDEKVRKLVETKIKMDTLIYSLKREFSDQKFKREMLDEIQDVLDEKVRWLKNRLDAEMEILKIKKKELEESLPQLLDPSHDHTEL